ncbi:MAG: site-specific DNA-methyltransferase [Melioribacteraceae bacterium]|nr:site-specific DNA-methyltransferase [Melioribacteraceae bacterium]
MNNFPLPRLDKDSKLYEILLNYCRLKSGEKWEDPEGLHSVGCIDCTDEDQIKNFIGKKKFTLAVHDPPYNLIAFKKMNVDEFILWCSKWIKNTEKILTKNSSLYVWLGADYKKHFQPFAEFIIMIKGTGFKSQNMITMRNQRGYGTQKNWMSVRQELLFYSKGEPVFNSANVYTDIPKILRGYYKEVNGKITENFERSHSDKIRAGNVWVDIQQVFHLKEENVNGCFAQKPLQAIERIIKVSSAIDDRVVDFFSHSGTTLLAAERTGRKCSTIDIDPVFCEISIRRLEHFRETGLLGWQNSNPFAKEILNDKKLIELLRKEYNMSYKLN